jgi:hypothetical protein
MPGMSEATTEPHVNGTAPAAATADALTTEPCDDCATTGEKTLAVLAAVLGAFIIAMAIDMFTGGKITGYVRDKAPQ